MLKAILENKKSILGFLAFIGFLIVLPLFVSRYLCELFTQVLILSILAMSLDILLGYTGLPSLGHAVYSGMAAYTTAILLTRYQSNFPEAMILSLAVVTFAAAIFGLLALRATSHYFLLITIALTMLAWGLAYRWTSLTNGENGIANIPRPNLGLNWNLRDSSTFYYSILICFVVALMLMIMIVKSPFGKTLIGIRESPSRMRALGYDIWLHKYLAFIITGIFSGFAGVLWVSYQGLVSPVDLEGIPSLEAILMVALGGPGTLFGAMIGAAIVVFFKNFVSVYIERWMMVMGVMFILTVIYAPDGIVGLMRRGYKRWLNKEHSTPFAQSRKEAK